MHSYCAGCYAEWMVMSEMCPLCKGQVKRVAKNHILNNIVESYLASNPDKKRPKQDLDELNEKSKIVHEMVNFKSIS
jgi:E3 ubiquitin-protein ligase CHFR